MTTLSDKEMKDALKSVKIGTPAQVFWTDAERKLEDSIMTYEESLLSERAVLKIAKRRIAEEKEKFK